MRVSRFLKKSYFYISKFFIDKLAYIDNRYRMKYYNRLIKQVGVIVNGTPRFIAGSVKFDTFNLIEIGDRCVISANVRLLTHDYSYTTALISVGETPPTYIAIIKGIKIGNNVFIGMNCLLLPGTIIGDNVIIGAGAVVRGTVPSNVVILGNPAMIVSQIDEHVVRMKNKKSKLEVDKR